MARGKKRPLKEDLKELFAMNRGERRAFAVLLGLCLVGAAWVTWEQWLRPRSFLEKPQLEVAWWGLQDTTPDGTRPARKLERDVHLFNFDPNGLPIEQWTQLGLTEKQAGAIHRYEEHGGKFRTKGDLSEMRVVDPDLYEQWRPYIQLPDSMPKREWKDFGKRERFAKDSSRWNTASKSYKENAGLEEDRKVELNTADSATLVGVRGIGPSFARSIIRYRERLGGFVDLDQLSEVYILRDKPEAVERLKSKLTLDPAMVKRFRLNKCTVEELASHPYVGWKLANALVAYRDHHGPFPDAAAISGCALVTDSIKMKLVPYLIVDQ